jgi:hypothetical protein
VGDHPCRDPIPGAGGRASLKKIPATGSLGNQFARAG